MYYTKNDLVDDEYQWSQDKKGCELSSKSADNGNAAKKNSSDGKAEME